MKWELYNELDWRSKEEYNYRFKERIEKSITQPIYLMLGAVGLLAYWAISLLVYNNYVLPVGNTGTMELFRYGITMSKIGIMLYLSDILLRVIIKIYYIRKVNIWHKEKIGDKNE